MCGRTGREQAGETLNEGFPWEQMKSQEQKQRGEVPQRERRRRSNQAGRPLTSERCYEEFVVSPDRVAVCKWFYRSLSCRAELCLVRRLQSVCVSLPPTLPFCGKPGSVLQMEPKGAGERRRRRCHLRERSSLNFVHAALIIRQFLVNVPALQHARS